MPIRKNANQQGATTEGARGPDLRWDDLSLLLALLRAGTLSGAGQRMGLSTSTVSRRLDAMEASLQVHLFDRTPAGLGPTALAEALAPVAESMELAAADALRLLADRETEPEGTVRITAPPGLANWFIAPTLTELHERYPKLLVELDASVGYADLTRREADLALRSMRPRSGDLVSVRLAEVAAQIVAAPELVERLGPIRDLDELAWITWGSDLAHLSDGKWIAQHVSPERVVLRTSSMDAQLHAARAGLGAMLVPPSFVHWAELQPVRLGRALARRLPPMPRGSLWLVGHRALRRVPRVQAVWDLVLEKAALWGQLGGD